MYHFIQCEKCRRRIKFNYLLGASLDFLKTVQARIVSENMLKKRFLLNMLETRMLLNYELIAVIDSSPFAKLSKWPEWCVVCHKITF